jgi:hypothetical protein
MPRPTRTLALCLVSVAMVSGCSHCAAPTASDEAAGAAGSSDATAEPVSDQQPPDPPSPIKPRSQPASCGALSLATTAPNERIGHSTTQLGPSLFTIGGYAARPEERCLVSSVLRGPRNAEHQGAAKPTAAPDPTAGHDLRPGERWGHTSTALGDGLLVVGGSLDDPELSPPRVAATAWYRRGWRTAPQPTSARVWHAAAPWQNGVVVAGGRTGDSSTTSVEYFTTSWTQLPDLPSPVFGAAVAATPVTLLVAGGAQGHGCGRDCAKDCYADEDCRSAALCNFMSFCEAGQPSGWVLAPGKTWTPVQGLRTGMGATATALKDGSFVIAGGHFNAAALGDVWRVRDGQATRIASLQPRFHHTATVLPDGRIAFLGGETLVPCDEADCDRPIRRALATVQILNPADGMLVTGAGLGHARSRHTAMVVGNGIQVLGGWGTDRSLVAPETYSY